MVEPRSSRFAAPEKRRVNRPILLGAIATMVLSAPIARGATLETIAVVVGEATDAQYDGVFETLYDSYAGGEFGTTTAGRVFGSFESERRSITEFAIGSIPSGSLVTSAMLLMDFISGSTERGVYAAFGRVGDGLLSVADATVTSTLAGAQPASFNLSIDVTAFLQNLVDLGASHAGFTVLEWVDGVNSNFVVGSGFAGGRFAPTLHVDYVPEPRAESLNAAAIALLGVLVLCRRRARG